MSLTLVPVTDRPWSSYQLAVFREIENGRRHLAIRARAGSGKTTALEECLSRIPQSAGAFALAFNKGTQTELQHRIARRDLRNVQAWTFHSFGFSAIRSAFGRDVQVDDHKVDGILRERFADDLQKSLELRRVSQKLVGLAKNCLASTEQDLERLIDVYGLDVSEEIHPDPDLARKAVVALATWTLDRCRSITAVIDYDDMVWLPAVLRLRLRQADFVFVDEVQDLNVAQIDMVLRAVRPRGGRVVVVGDDRQAIYQFRGADEFAFQRVVDAIGAKVMPLSITYRCPRAVVRLANRIVPDLEAAPDAEEGLVESTGVNRLIREAEGGDFVLSRTNAPLVSLCMQFIREGRRAMILGRDVGQALAGMVKRSKASTVTDLTTWVEAWRTRETARLVRAEREAAIEAVSDKTETLLAIAADCETIDEVKAKLTTLFSDDDNHGKIVLSTTHKAKGLERDVVWILRDTYMKRVSTEEENLLYVAITRARKTLRLVMGAVE